MKIFLFGILALAVFATSAQTIPSAQVAALNNYVEYANHSVREIESVTHSVIAYYPQLKSSKAKQTYSGARYSCPLQQELFYYKKAITDSKALGNASKLLNTKLEALKDAANFIDSICHALDVYHKLEDYKTDHYAQAENLIRQLLPHIDGYRLAQRRLYEALQNQYAAVQKDNKVLPYPKAIVNMLAALLVESSFLDQWNYNLEEEIPTGWPVEKLRASIEATDLQIQKMQHENLAINYPASSQYKAFMENMGVILTMKRDALDDDNVAAKKSDAHSNAVYKNLINSYNGTLVSFYNSFVQYAQQENHRSLLAMEYVGSLAIRSLPSSESMVIIPFPEIPLKPLQMASQSKTIPTTAATALNTYVDFINECIRQSGFMQRGIDNLSSSAARYQGLTSFQGKGALHYSFNEFKIPYALQQEAMMAGKVLAPAVYKALNGQADVLIAVLKEMESRSALLARDVAEKNYERDQLKVMFQTFDRYAVLFEAMDQRKEALYDDVRRVYDSYATAAPTSSWIISWKALRQLVDDDHKVLFEAKQYYRGKAEALPNTAVLDQGVRSVLSKEYENMKGIEKYGRYNGLCPYSPYEDIPKTSRQLAEEIEKMKVNSPPTTQRPYHQVVYFYNDIVNDYNKFCELSKLNLLKTVHQPELQQKFLIVDKQASPTDGQPQAIQPIAETQPAIPVRTTTSRVVRDTVYIEKHDTIYLADSNEDVRSMEGYAINNLVLLIDVSGSMSAPDKLPLLKQSILNLLSMMRAEDQIAMVIYSGKAKVVLQPVSFKDDEKIKKAIASLQSAGKTDGNAGLTLAYQVADKNYLRGGNNRIVLATDGEFFIRDDIFKMVDTFAKQDIAISVFSFGHASGGTKNLEKLCATGRGNFTAINKGNMELKLIREVKARRAK